jgi:two-component SAPR family response regulator
MGEAGEAVTTTPSGFCRVGRNSSGVQGSTVLIVDDDAQIRDVLYELLQEEGYHPVTASDGRQAIDYLQEVGQLPDAMLLDLAMPDIDGYGVLEHLRRSLLHEFPVLIISAQRPDRGVLRALDSELRDFIAKPFELEELVIRLERLVARSPRLAPSPSGSLRVYGLGSLRVYRDDVLLFDESWRNKPAKTIFKLLFASRGQRYPKDVLLEELWPEAAPEVAANRLRVAVHELRKALGEGSRKKTTPTHVAQQEGSYYFDTSVPYWSDVREFEEQIERGRAMSEAGNVEEALLAYRRAEVLYSGDFLRDDPFFEWTVSTREQLREAHLTALSDAARIYAQMGEPDEAAGFCRKILRVEPWREEVYRRLMTYLASAGRPQEALRAFEDCRRALYAEIEAEPAPATSRLRDAIARGEERLPADELRDQIL